MSALLGLFGLKLPTWVYELIAAAVAALVLHLWWVHHNHVLVAQGVQQQQNADNAAKAVLDSQTAAKTAALAKAVSDAEAQRDQAKQDLDQYRAAHPLTADRLCDPPDAHGRGGGLSGAAGIHSGGSQGSAPGQVGQPVPAGDSPSAADRLRLLDAFGALFDDTDRQVDGLQTRLGIKQQ